MERQIAMRQHNLVLLWVFIIFLFCAIAGLVIYFAFFQNPPANISGWPKSPAVAPPTAPDVYGTPIQNEVSTAPTTIPLIEAEWQISHPDSKPGSTNPISQIVIDPDNPDILYALCNTGPGSDMVWQTKDNCQTWFYLGNRMWKSQGVYSGVQLPESQNLYRDNAVAPENWGTWQYWFRETVTSRIGFEMVKQGDELTRNKLLLSLGLMPSNLAKDKETGITLVNLLVMIDPADYIAREREARKTGFSRLFLARDHKAEKWVEISAPPFINPYDINSVALATGKDTIRLYVGGFENNVWQTEISMSEFEEGLLR